MTAILEADSTLTERYQTTVPAAVRKALNLNKSDRIHYTMRSPGEVVITRASEEMPDDPIMTSFLAFLEQDMQEYPGNIRPVSTETFAEAERLTAGIEVNLDEEE